MCCIYFFTLLKNTIYRRKREREIHNLTAIMGSFFWEETLSRANDDFFQVTEILSKDKEKIDIK